MHINKLFVIQDSTRARRHGGGCSRNHRPEPAGGADVCDRHQSTRTYCLRVDSGRSRTNRSKVGCCVPVGIPL